MTEEWAPQGIDVTKPSVARVYDAALGGKDNFEVDRVALAQLAEGMPEVLEMAKINRATLGRAVRVMAGELGVRQFLDLGAGLPSAENTHQVAQAIAPESRVVYVDKDPIVLAHGRALLAEDDRTAVITADLREPASVLKQPQVTGLIDFEQPVGVMLVAILHHLHDDEDPKGLVDAYMDAVPPGSPVFITHFCDFSPVAESLQEKFLRLLGTGRFRTPEEITAYFDGYELLEPGVVPNPYWRPDGRASGGRASGGRASGGRASGGPTPGKLRVAEQLHYTGMAIKK